MSFDNTVGNTAVTIACVRFALNASAPKNLTSTNEPTAGTDVPNDNVLPDTVSQPEIFAHCDSLNLTHPHLIFLPDHSQRYTHINGVQTNNGRLNLILCQPKDKLIKARQSLKPSGYYSYWSKDYLKEITGMEL